MLLVIIILTTVESLGVLKEEAIVRILGELWVPQESKTPELSLRHLTHENTVKRDRPRSNGCWHLQLFLV